MPRTDSLSFQAHQTSPGSSRDLQVMWLIAATVTELGFELSDLALGPEARIVPPPVMDQHFELDPASNVIKNLVGVP